jgi:hypothetical protein
VTNRYIATLALAAVLTLAAGMLVRRQLHPVDSPPPLVVAPTETAALQQLSQEGQARRLSAFFSDRAADVAALVEYVPASGASGLRWRSGDSLITTFPQRPVAVVRVSPRDSARTPLLAPSDSMRGEWALIVARRRDGGVVSAVGVVGGRLTTMCGRQVVSEYVIGVPFHDGLAGAALFDLSGRVVGIVARCGWRLIALPAGEMMRVLAAGDSLGAELQARLGVVTRPLDADTRRYFQTDSGLLVVEVADASPGSRAGLQPGDVLVRLDDPFPWQRRAVDGTGCRRFAHGRHQPRGRGSFDPIG